MNGVSIIIPTYNEEKCILKTLANLQKNVKVKNEIIIVDDSNDTTREIVKKFASKHQDIFLIENNPKNRGFVKALITGIESAKNDVIVMVMGDMCDDPKTINSMYKKILAGWEIVCGSRYMKDGRRIGGPEVLGYLSQLVCLIARWTTGIPTHDVTNSFKMYNSNVLKNLNFNVNADTAISMELIYQAYFNKAKITEIPTVWKGRAETRFKLRQRGPKYFKILIWGIENRFRRILRYPLKEFYC